MTSLTQKKKLKISKEDKLNEECGIFGISNHERVSFGRFGFTHSLQHRVKGLWGSFFLMEKIITQKKGKEELVGDHFTNPETLKKLPGSFSMGHNRYSTTGETSLKYPAFFADLHMGGLSIAHNGNLTSTCFF